MVSMAASSRWATSRLVVSSVRARAAASIELGGEPRAVGATACSCAVSPSSPRSASRRRSTAAASASSASARRLLAASMAFGSVILRPPARPILPEFVSLKATKICCAGKRLEKELLCAGGRRQCLTRISARCCAWRSRAAPAFFDSPRPRARGSPSNPLGPAMTSPKSPLAAAAAAAAPSAAGRDGRRPHDARAARPHGQRHPRARDGCGRAGEIRPSRPADGRGRHRDRAVHAVPEIRSGRSGLARPRPLRALGRPRLDAALRAAPSARLRGDDDRGDQALPPARLDHARPSGEFRHARRRDHDRAARPGARQRGRHGDRRAASRRRVRRRASSTTTPTCSPPTAT